jgi:L-amino acid N-acyltransferase YncA
MSSRHEQRDRARERAAQRNAADQRQTRFAERLERDRARRWEAELDAVMATQPGRAVMWALVRRAGVYESVWRPSAEIHYLAGRQDFGKELLAELLRICPDKYLTMESEARAEEARLAATIDAHHTRPASEGEDEDG